MKIDLPELERKLSYGINLTIKESTILLESMEGFIDDKIVLQEQINSKVKALTEIRANIEEHNQIYDLSVDTALLIEGIDGIAFEALAEIGGDDGQ